MAPQTAQILSKVQSTGYEFINSLAVVSAFSELLADNAGLNAADRNRFLTIIQTEIERQLRLLVELKLTPAAGASR